MKKIVVAIVFVFLSTVVFAQVGVNPEEEFYSHLERWESQGLISNLPPLRPYPPVVVKDILDTVIAEGNSIQKAEAQRLYEKYFDFPLHADFFADGRFKFSDDSDAKQAAGFGGLAGDLSFLEKASASYKLNIAAVKNHDAAVLPIYTSLPYTFRDAASIGPLDGFVEMNGSLAFGTPLFYVQGGITHNSFGDFYDKGLVVVPDAQHTANVSVVVNPGKWSYTHSLFMLGASTNSSIGGEIYPNKFMALHSLNANPLQWLSFSIYETVIYGDRFDPSYFIPMPFMVAQGITGFDDNLIMGVTFSIKPIKGLAWNTNVFIDDISLDDVLKFDFDTKIRGALQTGIKYSPLQLPFISLVQLDYTLVTPYMYAHKQNIYDSFDGSFVVGGGDAINYQAYTNAGKAIGSQLAPNSDRVALSATFEPISGLSVGLSGTFIRHANVNQSLTAEEALRYLNAPAGYFLTDGSINNHPHYGYLPEGETEGYPKFDYMDSASDRLMFMSQDTKMYIVQAGLEVDYRFPVTKAGQFSLGVGYTFEYIKNWGVQNDLFPGTGSINPETGEWTSGGKTLEDVPVAIETWKSQLKDITNNYLTVSVTYRY
ncbi:MAG: hypothetical protein J6B81_00210 [Spirochaetaceae bacterium]|nr:hypothetical protein [Spirochaetaceae bacterium]